MGGGEHPPRPLWPWCWTCGANFVVETQSSQRTCYGGDLEKFRTPVMVRAEMIRIFTLPDLMTWPTHKNDGTRLKEAELVRKMMCVKSRTATDSAHAAVTVVNEPADPLPLDGIHKFFVFHVSIYDPQH